MAKNDKSADLGQAEVQKAKDAEEDKGFFGMEVDPTPDHHYTVDGVTSGKPTPETDKDAHVEASKAAIGSRFPEKEGESK